MKIAGIVLIAFGVLALIYGGFRYTSRETVLDIGPLHATAEREHSVPIAPIAGALMLIGGAAMLIVPKRS